MTRILLASIVLLVSAGSSSSSHCVCHVAPDEHPSLGNADARANGGTVRVIRGRVLYPNYRPAGNVIVEVFENSLSTHDWITDDYKQIETQQRKIACVTDRNGNFCIPGLASGRYLLRVGVRDRRLTVSAVRMFVTVNRAGSLRRLHVLLVPFIQTAASNKSLHASRGSVFRMKLL